MKSMPTLFNRLPWRGIALAAVLLKFWLVLAQPVVAIGGAGHDDRLYLNLADHLLHGEWLGAYDRMTLAKGPMYSLWIAGTVLAGIPLPLANHLLYFSGCLLLVRALRPHLPSIAAAWGVFLLLWWNPMTFEMPVLGRVLRQNFYTPAALLLFAALIALETRRQSGPGRRFAWGALLGTSASALWLTREETIWIAPGAALLVAAAAWSSWRAGERLRPLLLPIATAALSAAAMLAAVCALNLRYYGWFGTVEFRAPEFISAYGALQRVKSSYQIHYVPITREARERIYPVSAAFAELRPFLEGDTGTAWAAASEGFIGHPRAEREIAGGWFMWSLRDAVAQAGHANSAKESLAFYARLAREVNAACDDRRLPARARRDTLVPPWRTEFASGLARELPVSLWYFATFRDFQATPTPSAGWPELLQLFRDLNRWPLSPSPEAAVLDRPQQQHHDAWRIAALNGIGRAVGWLGTAATALGLLLWLALPFRLRRGHAAWYPAVLATAALGSVLAVVLINTLVHVMSFPNRSPGAFAQAYPLLLLFAALMCTTVRLPRPAAPAAGSGETS